MLWYTTEKENTVSYMELYTLQNKDSVCVCVCLFLLCVCAFGFGALAVGARVWGCSMKVRRPVLGVGVRSSRNGIYMSKP